MRRALTVPDHFDLMFSSCGAVRARLRIFETQQTAYLKEVSCLLFSKEPERRFQ